MNNQETANAINAASIDKDYINTIVEALGKSGGKYLDDHDQIEKTVNFIGLLVTHNGVFVVPMYSNSYFSLNPIIMTDDGPMLSRGSVGGCVDTRKADIVHAAEAHNDGVKVGIDKITAIFDISDVSKAYWVA